jgi:hypothetical protein
VSDRAELDRMADQLRRESGEASGRPAVTPWHQITKTARDAWRAKAREQLGK